MRLLILFLSLPWWLFFPIAGGVAWLAFDGQASRAAEAAAIEAALQSDPPDVTRLKDGVELETGDVAEVVLRAQVDTSMTTELVQRNNGVVTSRHLMYVLVAEAAEQTPDVVQGLIIVPMAQQDKLISFLVSNTTDFGSIGPVVELPGWIDRSHGKGTHAGDALNNQGHDRAATLFYLEPFMDGREAGLRAQAADATEATLVLYLIAAGIAGVGLVKFGFTAVMKRGQGPRMDPATAQAILDQPPATHQTPGAYAALSPEEEAQLTPLQRIKRRQALGNGAVAPPSPAAAPTPRAAAPTAAAPVAETTVTPRTNSFDLNRFKTQSPVSGDGFDSSPIKSSRRRSRKADPFDKIAEEAARL